MTDSPTLLRLGKGSVLTALALVSCTQATTKPLRPSAAATKIDPQLAVSLRAAVAAANTHPELSDRPHWSLEEARTLHGWTIEVYRLGFGPRLVLLVDPDCPATSYEAWFPNGWGDDPRGQAGLTAQLIDHYARVALDLPIHRETGVGRNMAFARWIVSQDNLHFLSQLLEQFARPQPPPPKLPPPSSVDGTRIYHQLERTLHEAQRSSTQSNLDVTNLAKADERWTQMIGAPGMVWIVMGAIDRQLHLETFRRQFPPFGSQTSESESSPKTTNWPPRLPFEVTTPADVQVMLAQWELSQPSPMDTVALEAIALLLADGTESRWGRTLWGHLASGIEVRTETHHANARLSLFAALENTASATTAASMAQNALNELADGATTGLEMEYAQIGVHTRLLARWASLRNRGNLIFQSLWAGEGLDNLDQWMTHAAQLEEPMVRNTARELAKKPPAVIWGRPGRNDDVSAHEAR